MRALIIKKLLFITTFTIFSLNGYSASVVKLTNGEWPPYMSEKYKHYGVMSHIVSEAFKTQGIKVEYGFFPWKRAFKEAEAGKEWAGSIGWGKNAEREKTLLFTDPIIELKDVFFHRKDFQFDWNTVDDLKKYKIGASTGYSYGKAFDEAEKNKVIKVHRTAKDENNLKKVLDNKIDIFPATMEVGYEIIANKLPPAAQNMLTNHPKPLDVRAYHVIISKNAADGSKLVEAFNKGLQMLKDACKNESKDVPCYDKLLSDNLEGKYRP
ncbi:substrate-binding periplasmic protein [Zooshikella sp. RANM57]|uniref:substrate-binding periplasmic protein n=1 Tax=Zooshikella sp. RANM57 TaxID=3425863 RepID=UPI003D6FA9F5